jgi:hypothetical protein
MSVNPHVDLLTQAWYRLGESRIMPSTLSSGRIVQARYTSSSNRCLLLPSGSLDSSRENPDSLRSTCWFNRAISDSRSAKDLSEDLSPMTGLGARDFQV